MVHLSPNIFAVAISSDLVLLDVATDRYLALPGSVSTGDAATAVKVHPVISILDQAAQVLFDAGLLTDRPNRDVQHLKSPVRSLPRLGSSSTTRPRAVDLLHLGVALIEAAWRFRSGMPLRGYASTRRRSDPLPEGRVAGLVERYRTMKLFVPTPRRCLPDAVVGALFLRRLGLDVEVVFGVRSHPFEAHCWLERDGTVLDDQLERVSGYAPIATAVL